MLYGLHAIESKKIKIYMYSAEEKNNFNHQRLIIYAVTTLALSLAYHFIRKSQWRSGDGFHTLPEAMATLMGITALCR